MDTIVPCVPCWSSPLSAARSALNWPFRAFPSPLRRICSHADFEESEQKVHTMFFGFRLCGAMTDGVKAAKQKLWLLDVTILNL